MELLCHVFKEKQCISVSVVHTAFTVNIPFSHRIALPEVSSKQFDQKPRVPKGEIREVLWIDRPTKHQHVNLLQPPSQAEAQMQ